MNNFTTLKRGGNGILGILMLAASIVFSREGFGFEDGQYWWVGWVMALAATGSQFMITSKYTELNLGIVALGLTAYAYSMYTNILGILDLQEVVNKPLAVGAGIFLDIYPEMALAWAMGASRDGDLMGNVWKVFQNPTSLIPGNQAEKPKMQQQQMPTRAVSTEFQQKIPRKPDFQGQDFQNKRR